MRHQVSPSETAAARTDDFFRSRLDQMIDLRHPLVRLWIICKTPPHGTIRASLVTCREPEPDEAAEPCVWV